MNQTRAGNKRKYSIAYLMHGARNVGGGENSIYFLITNLRQDLFDPVVFYSHENEITARLRKDNIRLIKVKFSERITSLYREEIRQACKNPFVYGYHLLTGIFSTVRLLKENGVEIFHPHDNLSKIIGGIAAKIAGVRTVTHCRDNLGDDLFGKLIRIIYKTCYNRIIAVSEKTKETMCSGSRLLLEKTEVIYNGVDLSMFDPCGPGLKTRGELEIPDGKVVLSVVAVLESYKGHVYLFEAMKWLKSDGIDNIVCLVIGDGREKEDLLRFVRDNDIQEIVKFMGYREDVPALLGVVDILVIPSIGQEAFPRVAIEAMSMKVPVVCTDFGGLPEAVIDGKTGFVVPSKDAEALYNALRRLIESPGTRKSMAEFSRKRVEAKFSIEQNVRKTEEVYLDVLKNS